VTKELRKQERVDNYWDQSTRLYLKEREQKHQVKMVNCSEGGLCFEVPDELVVMANEDRAQLVLQVGHESCAFFVDVKWVGHVLTSKEAGGVKKRRYGVRIDKPSASNLTLYSDYVQFLMLRRRFER